MKYVCTPTNDCTHAPIIATRRSHAESAASAAVDHRGLDRGSGDAMGLRAAAGVRTKADDADISKEPM